MDQTQKPSAKPIEIPFSSLSEEALAGVIDSFIQREGTDYGSHEVDYLQKVKQVRKQIEKGHVRILFEEETASVTLVTENEWKKISRQLEL